MNQFQKTFQGFLFFHNYRHTWSFPREIERLIMDETSDGSVLHLYGGLARFGVRLDMDPATHPTVIGNALYPPFKCKSVDYVVMDPPYTDLRGALGSIIITPAACLARKKVFWVHTHHNIKGGLGLRMRRWWVGSSGALGSQVRILVEYDVVGHPPTCIGYPEKGRRKHRAMLKKYDWSRHVPVPKRYEQPEWQQKLI